LVNESLEKNKYMQRANYLVANVAFPEVTKSKFPKSIACFASALLPT